MYAMKAGEDALAAGGRVGAPASSVTEGRPFRLPSLRRTRPHPKLSLRRKIPLLVSGLTAATLLLAATLAYVEVRAAALATAQARLESIVAELERLTAAGQNARSDLESRVAESSGVRAALGGAALDTARLSALLGELRRADEAGLPVSLLRPDGTVAFSIGGLGEAFDPDSIPPTREDRAYGPLRSVDGRILYWLTIPVPDTGLGFSGWVAQRRRMGNPQTGSTLGALMGSGIRILLGTLSDPVWVDLSGSAIERSPVDVHLGSAHRARMPGGSEGLAVAARLSPAPWIAEVMMPMSQVMARPHAFGARAIVASAALILLTAVLAWLFSGRLTGPLSRLATAADSVAVGNYDLRVQSESDDELGRLASAFNEMAVHVKRSDRELKGQLAEARSLASLLREANLTAEKARGEADAANRLKSEMLATVSHEIRTPITVILTHLDLVEAESEGRLTARGKDYLKRIDGASELLMSLLNDLLEFSRIESGEMHVADGIGRVPEVISASVAALEPSAEEKGISIQSSCREDVAFRGDPQRVQQIVLNLVSNAIKFTPPGGSIVVSGARTGAPPDARRGAAGWVRIDVEDDGIGMDEDQISRVFEPFVQGGGEREGAGLGLAISRRLAAMMRGELTADSTPDEGSRFTLWLPEATSPRSSAHPSDAMEWLDASPGGPSTGTTPSIDVATDA